MINAEVHCEGSREDLEKQKKQRMRKTNGDGFERSEIRGKERERKKNGHT